MHTKIMLDVECISCILVITNLTSLKKKLLYRSVVIMLMYLYYLIYLYDKITSNNLIIK